MVYDRSTKCFLRKLFIIVVLLFVPFFIVLKSTNVSATSITSLTATQVQYTKNFDNTMLFYNWSNVPVPITVLSVPNPTGVWDYSMQFSFPNPSSDTGSGFTHTIYFTLDSPGPYANENLNSYMAYANLEFSGIDSNLPYCSKSYNVESLTSSSVRFMIQSTCPNKTYSDSQSYSNVLATITYHPQSIFWCANDSSRVCPSNFAVTLRDVDYYFEINENTSTDDLLQQQINQNSTIINQNSTIINQNQEYYNHEYQAEDNISNQSASDISDSTSSQTTSIIGTIQSFVTAMASVQTGTCQMTLPFPSFLGGDTVVNPCTGKDKAPTIVTIGSSMFLIGIFIPFAFIVLKMIYNEIRSFTNG